MSKHSTGVSEAPCEEFGRFVELSLSTLVASSRNVATIVDVIVTLSLGRAFCAG